MLIKFKDILPNPYRDFKINPLLPEKLDELVSSINRSGFWDNVVVRVSPADKTKFELAYGHNRVEAAKRAGLKEANFIVREFDNAAMITVMKDDNMDFRHSALSTIEAVRAVVEALAKGDIPPFEINPKTKRSYIRYAPRYTPGDFVEDERAPSPHMRYTALDVAKILGYTESEGKEGGIKANEHVPAALKALFLIQEGHAEFSDFAGLSTKQLIQGTSLKFEQILERKTRMKEEAEQHAAQQALKAHREEIQAEIKTAQKALTEAEALAKKTKAEEELKAVEAAKKEKQAQLQKALSSGTKKHLDLAKQYLQANQKSIPSKVVDNAGIKMAEIHAELKNSPDIEGLKTLEDAAINMRQNLLDAKLAAEAKAREKSKLEKAKSKRKEKLKRQIDWYELLQTNHTESVKSLTKEDWTPEEREALRQKALDTAEAFRRDAALFLPPLSGKREGKKK